MPETAYALYVGIDWGTVTHQVAVLDAQRVLLGERATTSCSCCPLRCPCRAGIVAPGLLAFILGHLSRVVLPDVLR